MTFFCDANLLVYASTRSTLAPGASDLIDAIAAGEAAGVTSTAVLEEVWHIELSGRAGVPAGATALLRTALGPVLGVDDEILGDALRIRAATSLGANDRIHVATCRANSIGRIVTADRDFDQIENLHRVDPLDADALVELVAG